MDPKDIEGLSPEIVDRFRTAVELGKWPDGTKLTAEQRKTCMQAVILFDYKNKDDGSRVGDITAPGCASKPAADEQIATLKWADDVKKDNS